MRQSWISFFLLPLALCAQEPAPAVHLLSEPGPTFRVADDQLPAQPLFITYGDQRFTDPANTTSTNPRIRKWLVDQIASERPDAIIMNGDLPLAGNVANDYQVFLEESKPWRDENRRVFPAFGNHEFHGDGNEALENWWHTFPRMRDRRWYSVQLGSRVYLLVVDSDMPLLPGSEQARWIDEQIKNLPLSVDFLLISLHHPPVADIQKHIQVSHNPRPNEIALRDYLTEAAKTSHAAFLVVAGHIHNYERALYGGITYLVSGGGGAPPHFVERTPEDQYKSVLFPNYHYVELTLAAHTLHGAMYRVADPEAATLHVELKDSFDVTMKSGPERPR